MVAAGYSFIGLAPTPLTVFISVWDFLLRAGTYAYYRVNYFDADTKIPQRICRPWWNHRNNFFYPILLNDSSKEPEGCDDNRHVSAGLYG